MRSRCGLLRFGRRWWTERRCAGVCPCAPAPESERLTAATLLAVQQDHALAAQTRRALAPDAGRFCWRDAGQPAATRIAIELRPTRRRHGRSKSNPASTTTPLTTISA